MWLSSLRLEFCINSVHPAFCITWSVSGSPPTACCHRQPLTIGAVEGPPLIPFMCAVSVLVFAAQTASPLHDPLRMICCYHLFLLGAHCGNFMFKMCWLLQKFPLCAGNHLKTTLKKWCQTPYWIEKFFNAVCKMCSQRFYINYSQKICFSQPYLWVWITYDDEFSTNKCFLCLNRRSCW